MPKPAPANSDDAPDMLVPDPVVWREFGISSMTGWRWSNDPKLGFPPPIKIRTSSTANAVTSTPRRMTNGRRPVDIAEKPVLQKPVASSMTQQDTLVPTPERLALKNQRVIIHNTSREQTHIIIDRNLEGVELRPGERKEIDMTVDEIENLRHLGRSDRGFYKSGHNVGKPLPPHPVRVALEFEANPEPIENQPAQAADLSGSNSLANLAARIRAEHEGARAAVKRGVEHAIAAGDLLIEAKAKVAHGQWLPWLTENCAMSERTARLYMRVARGSGLIEAENGNVADLSLRGAVALISLLMRIKDEARRAKLDDVQNALREIAEEPAEQQVNKVSELEDRYSKPRGKRSAAAKRNNAPHPAPVPEDEAEPGHVGEESGQPEDGADSPTGLEMITEPPELPPALRRTDGDGKYETFKSRWVQYCEADFAALPAAMQTRFVTEVLRRDHRHPAPPAQA
jgi:hypothetical protein